MTRRAHTLAEMMVVITILVLIAGIMGPRFVGTLLGVRGRAGAEQMRDALAYAHARAVSTGLRHVMRIDANANEHRLFRFEPEATGGAPPTEPTTGGLDDASGLIEDGQTLMGTGTLPEGVTIEDYQISPVELGATTPEELLADPNAEETDLVSFYPGGTSDYVAVVLRDERDDLYVVTLDGRSGRARLLPEEEAQELLEGLRR